MLAEYVIESKVMGRHFAGDLCATRSSFADQIERFARGNVRDVHRCLCFQRESQVPADAPRLGRIGVTFHSQVVCNVA
ncbi:MAG: hypothetical protein ACLQUY_11120, partial [Ktedonobacterales bacterium]